MLNANPKELIGMARQREVNGFLLESFRMYDEAIELLNEMIATTDDGEKRQKFLINIKVLEDYSPKLKERIETKNRSAKTIRIREGATGFSYEKLFGPFLDETVKEIHIYEPYTCKDQQLENLVCFFDLLMKNCKNLRFICLFTKKIAPNPNVQNREDFKLRATVFSQWIKQFEEEGIGFCYRLSKNKHDRRIELGNGITFVLGYGLDMYHDRQKFSLGTSDFNLLKCKETFVEIIQPIQTDSFENGH